MEDGTAEATPVELDWLARYEELVRAKERAEDRATTLFNRQRERHDVNVRWALNDLADALNRLTELDVRVEVDGVDLENATGEDGVTVVWQSGGVDRIADVWYSDADGHWAVREERRGGD